MSVRNEGGVVELQVHKWQDHVSQTDRCTDRQILASKVLLFFSMSFYFIFYLISVQSLYSYLKIKQL